MKSPCNTSPLRERSGRRRRSPGCSSAAVLLSLATTTTGSSALLSPSSPCFVSPRSLRGNSAGEVLAVNSVQSSSSLSRPRGVSYLPPQSLQHSAHAPATRWRQSRLMAMNENDDEQNNIEDEDEEYNEMRSNLSKISWLPSVKLGKQPYNPASFGQMSRKESAGGDSYETLEGSDNEATTPPGFQNIEILPVLPMTMVHGLDERMFESKTEEEPLEGKGLDHDSTNPYYADAAPFSVWDEESTLSGNSLGPMFSGTSDYLPHTKGHVFTVAEPRYKKLYDDLLRMGNYYGMKRDSALKRAREEEMSKSKGSGSLISVPQEAVSVDVSSLPDPDEKRRFIVTASNPAEDGVFAQYGLLFQLKDLDEVAAVASYEMGGDGMTMEEIQDLVEEVQYNSGEEVADGGADDVMDILLRTHYEATHDVVGRVKIHRFVNPECYLDSGPDGDEYLMAEATILDVIESDKVKMMNERKTRRTATTAAVTQEVEREGKNQPTTSFTTGLKMDEPASELEVGEMAKAVARIKEELRSSVGEAFKQQVDSESIRDKLRSVLDDKIQEIAASSGGSSIKSNGDAPSGTSAGKGKGPIPLGPKGMYVERRSDDSLTKPERALRESFTKLVSLQHELREECRLTRVSVQTFGIGPVGVWLSAAAWSQFVEKRLEASHVDMQGDLQAKLVEYLANRGSSGSDGLGGYFTKYADDESGRMEGYHGAEGMAESIDFDELSPDLQREFQLVQVRATDELGPLALERAIQMQRIVQAENYDERLDLLRECVDSERRRLEAKKMLLSLTTDRDGVVDRRKSLLYDRGAREEARSLFEKLMSADSANDKSVGPAIEDLDEDAFQ